MAKGSFLIKSGILNLQPEASPPSNPALGDLYVDSSGDLKRFDGVSFASMSGGTSSTSVTNSKLTIPNLISTTEQTFVLASTASSSPPDDGSVLGGSLATGTGTGEVLGGSSPALGGTGGVLGGATPPAGGTGGVLGGSIPALAGTGGVLGGSAGSVNFLSSLFFFPVYSFTSPTTSVTATLRSSLGSGPFHNVPINLGTGVLISPTSSVNERVFLRVQSQNNSDFKDSPPISLNIPISSSLVKKLSNTRNNEGVTDGTSISFSNPVVGTSVYFASTNSSGGQKIFKFNSATQAVSQVSNIRNSQSTSDSISLGQTTTLGSKIYFSSLNTSFGTKLFQLDTTNDSIVQLSNTRNSQSSADITGFASTSVMIVGSFIYFTASNQNNVLKIYKLDTSTGLITQVSNIRGNQTLADLSSFGSLFSSVVGSSLYFVGFNSNSVDKIFKIDTTTDTITQISNTRNVQTTSDNAFVGASATVVGTSLYFSANNANGFSKVFKIDTTTDLVTQISNTRNSQSISDSASMGQSATVVGTSIYFNSNNANGAQKVYKINTSTDAVTRISNTINSEFSPDGFSMTASATIVVGTSIYATALNANSASKVFKINTLTDNVTQVSNTVNSQSSSDSAQLGLSAVVVGNSIYYLANNRNLVLKLFKIDTTTDTVTQISNTRNNQTISDNLSWGTTSATVVGTSVYFSANNANGVQKVFKLNTTTDIITQISNTRNDQTLSDSIGGLGASAAVVGSSIFYTAQNRNGVTKLFKIDTTTDQVSQVADTRNSSILSDNISVSSSAQILGSSLVFSANNSSGFTKLYSTTP